MLINSIFRLIHLFSRAENPVLKVVEPAKHCEQNSLHDFYCDAERPYSNKSIK